MNLAEPVLRHASERGDRVAMVCEGRRQTYRQLSERAQRLVRGLRGLGVAHGECIALLVDNGPYTLEQIVALSWGGFVRAPLYTHDPPERHRYLLDLTGAVALIVDARHYEALAPVLGECAELRHVVVVGEAEARDSVIGTYGVHAYENLVEKATTEPIAFRTEPHDPYQIRFSAGTTGLPKGILHDIEAWIAVGEMTVAVLDRPVSAQDRYLAAGPLTHAASMPVWPVLAAGGTIVVLPAFDPGRFLDIVQRERVTMTLIVPTMVQLIAAHPDASQADLSSLRAVFYGASPMPEAVLLEAIGLWGNIMYQLYGQSEVAPVTSLVAADHLPDGTAQERSRLRSAGRPIDGAEVRIEADDGRILPPGEIGEVTVRTPGQMREIWKDPEATRARVTEDGWVRTRDMGWLDEEGFLFLADRKEDMIISGGFNIWPAELENALMAHPGVREAAVVGVAHPRWGETPRAAVVREPDYEPAVTEEELIAWTRERVGSVKKVTGVHFVDELPKTPIGKVLRRVVRDRFEA